MVSFILFKLLRSVCISGFNPSKLWQKILSLSLVSFCVEFPCFPDGFSLRTPTIQKYEAYVNQKLYISICINAHTHTQSSNHLPSFFTVNTLLFLISAFPPVQPYSFFLTYLLIFYTTSFSSLVLVPHFALFLRCSFMKKMFHVKRTFIRLTPASWCSIDH